MALKTEILKVAGAAEPGTIPLSRVAPVRLGAVALKYTYIAVISVAFIVPLMGTFTLLTVTGCVVTSIFAIYNMFDDEPCFIKVAGVVLVVRVTLAACMVLVPAMLLWLLVIFGAVANPKTGGAAAPLMMMVWPSTAVLLALPVII